MDHIHAVAVTDDGVFVGTHNGLWQVSEDGPATRVSAEEWDVMGLAHDGQDFLASGHPGPGMDAPGNLGLQRSPDAGVTWRGVSLVGDVDFHNLAAHGNTVAGIDSQSGLLLTSRDSGAQWVAADPAPFFDVVVLASGDIVALTAQQRWHSRDGGQTWQQVAEEAITPRVVTSHGQGLVAVDAGGRLLTAATWDAPWQVTEADLGRADGISVHGDTVAVVAEDQVLISRDGGVTFVSANTGR
jgi:photosystem II stability/assembly factor-like uncharacterized protein